MVILESSVYMPHRKRRPLWVGSLRAWGELYDDGSEQERCAFLQRGMIHSVQYGPYILRRY
jgi:hypothetical protein